MTDALQFDVDGLDPDLIAEAKRLSVMPRKQNPAPRGPASVRVPLTGRALRRAMGQTNKDKDVVMASEIKWFDNTTSWELIPSPRAPKRTSGSRKKIR